MNNRPMEENVEIIEKWLKHLEDYSWKGEKNTHYENRRKAFENRITRCDIIIPFEEYVRLETKNGYRIWADNREELLANKDKYVGKRVIFGWIEKYETEFLYADIVD